MRKYPKIIFLLILISIVQAINMPAQAQQKDNIKVKKQKTNYDYYNNWGVSILYSENGFGLAGMYYKNLSRTTDLFFRLAVSGVSDNNESEFFDEFGNSFVPGKINRIFNIPFSIGIQKYLFYDDIEGNFKPYINGGFSPSLILMTPYNSGFFSAFQYTQTSYSIGGFVGAGLEYFESPHVAMNFDLKYYYLPVLGSEVKSLENKPINNVGGLQINFGLSFLR